MGADLLKASSVDRLDNLHMPAIIGPHEYGTHFRRAAVTPRRSAHYSQHRTHWPVHRTVVGGLRFARRVILVAWPRWSGARGRKSCCI